MLDKRFNLTRNVFFDIDNTIASSMHGYDAVGYFEHVLAGVLCRLKGMSFAASLEAVLAAEGGHPFFDPFKALSGLGIPLDVYRAELEEFQKRYLHVFEDAVAVVKMLKEDGHELFITSNNSESRAWAVLHAAGLSDWTRSDYFSRVFCPETVGFRKDNPEFYRKVLKEGGLRPEETLVIGDDIVSDGEAPKKAGIGLTVIIDRKRRLKSEHKWIVSDLRDILFEQGVSASEGNKCHAL